MIPQTLKPTMSLRVLAPTLFSVFTPPALALSQLPLDGLQQGLWRIDRTIERIAGGDPAKLDQTETRHSEYCVDPKQEILRTMKAATLLCKTETNQAGVNLYLITARCSLPGISGESRTLLSLISPTRYRAEVETKGSKLREFQHRRESIQAERIGNCSS